MSKAVIIVAAHKEYRMPQDPLYLPLQVGAAGKPSIGYQRDDEGENISALNPYFCELTGLYWAWKNLDADYIGLSHYRRHFVCGGHLPRKEEKRFSRVMTGEQTELLLQKAPVILPCPRKYYIENLYGHYCHTLNGEPLARTREILERCCPEYLPEFDRLRQRRQAHMFNMMVMRRDLLDRYCDWLFPILTELTQLVNPKQYDPFQARYPGRVSELLLDVWVMTNHISYTEARVAEMQPVNWLKKGSAFLLAKFTGKRYEKSF